MCTGVKMVVWLIGFYPQRLRKGIFVSGKAHVFPSTLISSDQGAEAKELGGTGGPCPPPLLRPKMLKVPLFFLNFPWTRCPGVGAPPHFLTHSSASGYDWSKSVAIG